MKILSSITNDKIKVGEHFKYLMLLAESGTSVQQNKKIISLQFDNIYE